MFRVRSRIEQLLRTPTSRSSKSRDLRRLLSYCKRVDKSDSVSFHRKDRENLPRLRARDNLNTMGRKEGAKLLLQVRRFSESLKSREKSARDKATGLEVGRHSGDDDSLQILPRLSAPEIEGKMRKETYLRDARP